MFCENLFFVRENGDSTSGRSLKVQGQRVIDSGGGFLIEEDDELEREMVYVILEYDIIVTLFRIMHKYI